MKHLLLLIFFVLIQDLLLQAQVIKLEPETVTRSFVSQDLSDPSLQLQTSAKVINLTNQEVRLKWTRVIIDQPMEWETQVCDNSLCWLPHISSNIDVMTGANQPAIIKADTSFDIGLYVVPNGFPGKGRFQLIFSLSNNPNIPIDTVTFEISVNQTTSTTDISVSDVRLYPNPAVDYFELKNTKNIDRLMVYNLLGREVLSYSVYTGQQYSLTGLPDGLYLVSLINDRKGVMKTIRLNKRSWRP
ncbi:MAG: T9SS type A sorting domain-containing protein [Saprospiraceae bacterium]|nr:T9SS type A sorting domain-containing protein [Saprospiraceae bacterium]